GCHAAAGTGSSPKLSIPLSSQTSGRQHIIGSSEVTSSGPFASNAHVAGSPALTAENGRASRSQRSAGLDIARAMAITAVLLAHNIGGLLSPEVMPLFTWIGDAGVELFFSLSGFLIGGLLIDLAISGITLRAIGSFYVR